MAKQPITPSLVIDEKAGTATIVLPLVPEPMRSKSHKNTTIATSNGNLPTTATHAGQPVTIGVNVYRPPVEADLENPRHAEWLAKQK